jgi:hypothetical protein
MAYLEEAHFGLTRMAWNGGNRFWPDWERFGIKEVGFGLTGMSWNEGSKSVLAGLEWFGL